MGEVSSEAPGKGERTFHDDLVGFQGHEDSVQRREEPNDAFGIDRSRQVVENDAGIVAVLQQPPDFIGGFERHAFQQRPELAARGFELTYQQQLVIIVMLDERQFPLSLGMDRPLGIVAVHDQHVVPDDVMQVTGEQYREG